MNQKQKILFLCNHNSARSQMAEAILESIDSERFSVFSAGLDPRPLDPTAIEVMQEIGIDISGKVSKSPREYLGKEAIHQVIFLCAEDEADCPRIYPFALEMLQWRMTAPKELARETGDKIAAFREVRDEIEKKIRSWIAEMDHQNG